MKESIKKYFKIGLVHFMAYPDCMKGQGPLLETFKKIAVDDYFDAIEITHIQSKEMRDQSKKLLETSYLEVFYGAQPRLLGKGLNPNHTDEKERIKAEAELFDALDEAHQMGAKGMAFLSGKWEETTKEQAFQMLKKTTKNICDYAKIKDMNVNLEVFDYDFDKASLIGPAPLAARFAAEMREITTNFGLLVDLSHIPQTYESSQFVIRTLSPYINHFHIGNVVMGASDNEAYGDTHPRFGFPKSVNGLPEMVAFLRVLKEEGFFCPENPYVMSFEVKPWKDEDPDVVLANAKRLLNRAWAVLEG